jgi:hypothetical protein
LYLLHLRQIFRGIRPYCKSEDLDIIPEILTGITYRNQDSPGKPGDADTKEKIPHTVRSQFKSVTEGSEKKQNNKKQKAQDNDAQYFQQDQ